MLLKRPPLEGLTRGTQSLQILEHVDREIPNYFDTSRMLRHVATWLWHSIFPPLV